MEVEEPEALVVVPPADLIPRMRTDMFTSLSVFTATYAVFPVSLLVSTLFII